MGIVVYAYGILVYYSKIVVQKYRSGLVRRVERLGSLFSAEVRVAGLKESIIVLFMLEVCGWVDFAHIALRRPEGERRV